MVNMRLSLLLLSALMPGLVPQPLYAQPAPQVPAFAPPTDRALLYTYAITRPAGTDIMRQTVSRCIRFTPIGRGYRMDAQVVAISSDAADGLQALLAIGQEITRDERLVVDLGPSGAIIGVQDLNRSWARFEAAVKAMRTTLETRIEDPVARAIGYKLLDSMTDIAPPEQQAALLRPLRPMLGFAGAPMQQDMLVFPATGQAARPVSAPDGIARFAIGQNEAAQTDAPKSVTSYGDVAIASDGLLLSFQQITRNRVGDSERLNTAHWQRASDAQTIKSACAGVFESPTPKP